MTKIIPLTRGQIALVSDRDYPRFRKFKWQALWMKSIKNFYAVRTTSGCLGKKRLLILMHREVLGLAPEDKRHSDHRNVLRTLDNRRSNLRICNPSQNGMNRRLRSDNTSGYKGVYSGPSWKQGRWRASLQIQGRRIFLGCFDTIEMAHLAYKKAAQKYFGKFARP